MTSICDDIVCVSDGSFSMVAASCFDGAEYVCSTVVFVGVGGHMSVALTFDIVLCGVRCTDSWAED